MQAASRLLVKHCRCQTSSEIGSNRMFAQRQFVVFGTKLCVAGYVHSSAFLMGSRTRNSVLTQLPSTLAVMMTRYNPDQLAEAFFHF